MPILSMFFFADAGIYELELTFEVPIRSEGDYNSILLPVIPVLNSHIQLSSFLDVRSIEIRSQGKVEPDVQQGELRADLGAADAIDVNWRINRSVDRDMEATCSQIGWLHANDARVSYSCKLVMNYPTGQVSNVSIVTESRLTPSANGDQPISIDKLDGHRNRFYFLPTLQSETEAVVHVQFDMVNTFGIGRIRLPRIEVENVRVTSHLLATSIDSSLVGIPWRTSGISAVPLSEFAEVWQAPSLSPPDYTYVVNDPEYTCIFGFESLNDEAQVSFETDYVLSESRTDINLIATINSGSNSLFQASFRIPDNVAISRVSTIQGSIRQPVDWARGDESTVTVFLPGGSTGPTLIEITGHAKNENGRFVAPSFAPVKMLSKDDRITLYRKPGVQITSIEEKGYSIIPADGTESKSTAYEGAIVHSSRLQNSDSATMAIDVQSREPDVELKSMLAFRESETGIEYDLQMLFAKGASECDILRLHVPSEWSVPKLDDMDFTVRSMPSPHTQSQIFSIRPTGRFQSGQLIRLMGRAADKTSQELSANVSVTGGRLAELVIGIRDDQSNSYWEPNGMTVHDVTPTSDFKDIENCIFYRGTSNTATFRQRRHVEDDSVASLQSIRHSIFVGDVRTPVVTDISIVAQGSGAIVLNLPAYASMQQASINGVPLQVRVDSNHRLPITIARSDEVQSIRFVWYSTQTRSERSYPQDFDFPQLVQESTSVSKNDHILETNETIWQFKLPKSLEGIEFFVSDRRLEPDDEHVLRDYALPSEPADQQYAFRVGRYGKNIDTRVRYVRPNRTSVYTRVMAAVTALCGGVFVVHTRFKPLTVPEAELWVYNGAVLFGIGWWLFLQPSLLGWGIVGGVLLIAWLTRW